MSDDLYSSLKPGWLKRQLNLTHKRCQLEEMIKSVPNTCKALDSVRKLLKNSEEFKSFKKVKVKND
jgi:hypothetical protein